MSTIKEMAEKYAVDVGYQPGSFDYNRTVNRYLAGVEALAKRATKHFRGSGGFNAPYIRSYFRKQIAEAKE